MNKITITTITVGIVGAVVSAILFVSPVAETASATSIIKTADETVSGEDVAPQDDDELFLSLGKNKTYAIDGVIFVDYSEGNDLPNFQRVAFIVPTGAEIKIGYADALNQAGSILDTSGQENAYAMDNSSRRPVLISGTVKMGSQDGTLQLQWGHSVNVSDIGTTTVEAGSFLRADQI